MQTSISAVRKDVEALRNATKLLLGRYIRDIQSMTTISEELAYTNIQVAIIE